MRKGLVFGFIFMLFVVIGSACVAKDFDIEKTKFDDLCQEWTDPPQNVTARICDCMFEKIANKNSRTSLVEVLKIKKEFWEKIPASVPANSIETETKEHFKACFMEWRQSVR